VTRQGSRVPAAIALAVVALACGILFLPARTTLTLRSQETGQVRFRARVSEGDEFVIAYVHSVNRRPVYDTLRVEGRDLRIVKSRFDAFGAGMPEATPDHPLRFAPDGWLEHTVDRRVPEVTLFVGRVAGHTLHVQGRAIPLAELVVPGSALRFAVEKQSLLDVLRAEHHNG
jgi:hypothetical protein